MKNTINTYFAVLLVTIFGSGAAFIIVGIATTNVIASAMNASEANYASLQESILKNQY